jgi:tRNA (uracil-5-)-methyltransferase TRM9
MDKNYAEYLLKKTRNDYNLIAEDFSNTRHFLWEELKPLSQYVQKGDKVLDLGCGNGRLVDLLREKEIDYVGVDNAERLIGAAKNKYPDNNFIVADSLNLPFPQDFFDKVFSIAVFHHIPSEEYRLKFLNEIKKVLKPKGQIILTVWNLWQGKTIWKTLFSNLFLKLIRKNKLDINDIFYPWKGQKGKVLIQRYIHLFTKEELKRLVETAGFKVMDLRITKREKGRGSNILLIAEK